MTRKYLDFDIIKESWDTYSLQDGTKLKVRNILKSVWTEQTDKPLLRFEMGTEQVLLCAPELQGQPDTKQYTPDQLSQYMEVKHCNYTTLQYEPSEYILDDGSRIVMHCTITNIARSNRFDATGNRVYQIELSGNIAVTPQN